MLLGYRRKSTKNHREHLGLEGFWAALGRFLATFSCVFQFFKRLLDVSGEALGPILVDFSASWGRLGVWRSPWAVLGRPGGVLERFGGALGQISQAKGI